MPIDNQSHITMKKILPYRPIAVVIWFLCFCASAAFSQIDPSAYLDKQGQLNYSSLDFWYARKVKESILLSGKTIDLYGVGVVSPQSDFYDTKLKDQRSPWATSNVYSKMVLDVGNTRVYPEKEAMVLVAGWKQRYERTTLPGLKLKF